MNYAEILINAVKTANEKGISMPNIPFPTMGGEFFWNTLAEHKGWRMQQNMFTQHVRIIDPDNIRRAWGSLDAMKRLFGPCSETNSPSGFSAM